MTGQLISAFRLDGKTALVTGGASGIGAGIAEVLAEAGAFVVIMDRDLQGGHRQVDELISAGFNAAFVQVDLADEASIVGACAEVVSMQGTPWILVNNAGPTGTVSLLLDGTAAQWDRMNAVNSRGPFLMIREISRVMVEAGGGGRIINVASAVLRGLIIKGLAAYAGSKGALGGTDARRRLRTGRTPDHGQYHITRRCRYARCNRSERSGCRRPGPQAATTGDV